MKYLILIVSFLCLLPAYSQAATTKGTATRSEQRQEIQRMEADVLARLYKAQPGAEQEIAKASGYAVFTSADLAVIFFSGSYGHGLAHDNGTGKETYMQMASVGVGLGVGVKDFRAVFIFTKPETYKDFISTGLDLSGNLDIAVKQGSNGGDITGAGDILPGVKVYQLTDTGLMAQAMLKGTKYWRDADLNESDNPKKATK
ncbi:MAG: hypothetical protein EPN97_09430 [Alphaproteobacteria bacterium]|nr:MAG: hypothetical protein EPN97_09430 [Alphaproteobacteria bacterium]